MKKRFLAALLALVMTAACLTACGGENKTEDKQQTTTTTTEETTTTTTEETTTTAEKETGVIDTTTTTKVTTTKNVAGPPPSEIPQDVNPGQWHEDSETTTTTTTTKAATTTKPKTTTTKAKTTTTKATTKKSVKLDLRSLFECFAGSVENFRSTRHSGNALGMYFFVYDIDGDKIPELVVWDMGFWGEGGSGWVSIYKYDPSAKKSKLYAEGEMSSPWLHYSKKLKTLITVWTKSSYEPGKLDYYITKAVISKGKITEKIVISGTEDTDKAYQKMDKYEKCAESDRVTVEKATAAIIENNAKKNKAV